MENFEKYSEELLMDCINLYVKGTLRQYGLSNEAALEIVSNLTKIPAEKLEEYRIKRVETISEEFAKGTETIRNILTR